MHTYASFMKLAAASNQIADEELGLLRKQTGWAKYVVHMRANIPDDAFISWRPEAVMGKHTKLKWLPKFYFFEVDTDAMLFMLTFSEYLTDEVQ
jgi:hypothetical protein